MVRISRYRMWLAVAAIAAIGGTGIGCGPPNVPTQPDSPNPSDSKPVGSSSAGAEPVVRTTRAVDPPPTDTFTGTAKLIVDWSGAIANLYGTYQAAVAILQAIGILGDPNQDILNQLQALHQQIDQVAEQISWFMAESDREQRLSDMRSSVFTTNDAVNSGTSVDWFNLDLSTGRTVSDATDPTAFERYYIDRDTNGTSNAISAQAGTIGWKSVIAYTQSDLLYDNGYVYDWRLGVPALTQLIGLRLQLMAMEDPNFTTDLRFHDELMSYHDALSNQVLTMNAGVRCNVVRNPPEYPNEGNNAYYPNWEFWVSCADIYTGLNETQVIFSADVYPLSYANCITDDGSSGSGYVTYDQACLNQDGTDYSNWYQTYIQPVQNQAYADVRRMTPVFGVQALLDTLYLYANGITDLTKADSTIRVSANSGLCLDVPGGNTQVGTVVQVYPCNGNSGSQGWTYDRLNQRISHNNSGLCLDVQNGSTVWGTPVWMYWCNGTDAQKWSWDPKYQVLNNALMSDLDVPWDNLVAGQTVWTWGWNDSDAQRWFY